MGVSKIGSIALALVAGGAAAWFLSKPAIEGSAPGAAPAASVNAAPLPATPNASPAVTPVPTQLSVPAPPQPETAGAAPSPLRELTLGLYQQLRAGPTAAACSAAEGGLLDLLGQSQPDSALWTWGMARARDCLRAPTPYRRSSPLLAALIDRFPDHPRVRELSSLHLYDSGDMNAAATSLGEVAEEADSFEPWAAYADAELNRMKELRAQNDPAWREAVARAEAAAMRALNLASEEMRPFALHTLARTQVEGGKNAEAVQYAAQAIEAVRTGGSRYQAIVAAELHVFGGQIFYRAGQRETGLAYMNQGISMAPLPEQRAGLQRIRDAFLKAYGG